MFSCSRSQWTYSAVPAKQWRVKFTTKMNHKVQQNDVFYHDKRPIQAHVPLPQDAEDVAQTNRLFVWRFSFIHFCFGTVRKRSFFYRVKLSFLGKIFLKDLFYHAVWKTHKKTVDKSCLCRGKPTTSFPHMHHCVLIQSTQKWRSIHRWVGWRSVCASEWERSDKGDLIFFWMVKKYENQWVSPTLRLKAAITSFN